jgi:hypothetical protein
MSSFGSRLRFASILALLISSFFGLAAGQSRQSGEIRGTVTDQSQAVLPGVKVTITNTSTGVVQTITTDASGVYDAPYVAPGEYSLTFSKDTFKTLVRDGIELHVQTVTINAALDVGMSSEKVTVTATQPDLETETTDTNTRFGTNLVADAPTGNRSWMDILASLPGVNPGWNEKTGGDSVGVNGQAGYFSNWQIDGGIAMFGQSSNADLLAPPIDSIEEVSANTSNFGAEHGSGFSVFNVITKSGTNSFHGTVYEYIQNDAFNALNKFAQSQPPIRWNEYGFNIGGPIKKDKAFFFFAYQRNPSNTSSPAPTSYPTTGRLDTRTVIFRCSWGRRQSTMTEIRSLTPAMGNRLSMVRSSTRPQLIPTMGTAVYLLPVTSFRRTVWIRWPWKFRRISLHPTARAFSTTTTPTWLLRTRTHGSRGRSTTTSRLRTA